MPSLPPQMIMSLPVHSALCRNLAMVALTVLVAVQLSVAGSYLPPVLKVGGFEKWNPPHIIISLPVHTALWPSRATGAFTIVVGVQVSSEQSSATEISGSVYVVSG